MFQIKGELSINKAREPPIKLQLKPERKSTNSPEKAIIKAVPRSGCLNTIKKQKKIINKLISISFR